MEETKTAEETHSHAAGKKIGMEFLRQTQIPTTAQQRDILFEMIDKGITQQQSANAELQAWKESEIKTTLPLFEMMHSHPEMKIGDSCIQKSIQFIRERDELKKQNKELKKQLKSAEKRLDKYSDYLSLTLDGVEPERAKKDCKL